MVRMAAIAPKGVFEDEDAFFSFPLIEEEAQERHFDDYSRNDEDVA